MPNYGEKKILCLRPISNGVGLFRLVKFRTQQLADIGQFTTLHCYNMLSHRMAMAIFVTGTLQRNAKYYHTTNKIYVYQVTKYVNA